MSMTKNAIRLREKRKNTSDEEKAKEAKRKKEARDAESKDKTNDRNARNAERMKNARKSGTDQEKAAKRAANAKRMRDKRAADKLAKTQNQQFSVKSTIQTLPRSLSHKRGFSRRNDETWSSGSDTNEDSISEYKKWRLQNIQESQQKFEEQFGLDDPYRAKTRKSARSKPKVKKMVVPANTDSSTSKNSPKRSCPLKICKLNDNSESDTDTSLDEHINDLLESAVVNDEIKQGDNAELVVSSVLDSMIPCHAPSECCK